MKDDQSTKQRLLFLSEQIGHAVVETSGDVIGRLGDLSVALDAQSEVHSVQRIVLQCRRSPDIFLPWSAVESFDRTEVTVDSAVGRTNGGHAAELGRDEILLVRDVLDTQIVDIAGQRLARVADVALSRTADGRLELVGVEVGFGGVLRRLGLARKATRTRRDMVAWTDLHLTSDRGHTVQLATPRSAVHHLDAVGLATLLEHLDTDSAAEVLAVTPPEAAAASIVAADPYISERVLRALPSHHLDALVAAMPRGRAAAWHRRLTRTPAFLGRTFLRSRVWPRRRRRTARKSRP